MAQKVPTYLEWALSQAAANPNFNSAVLPGGIKPPDYNYQMAYQQNPYSNPATNGHLSDIGKLPNHPTFSNESVYAIGNPTAGKWQEPMQGNNWLYHNPSRGLNYAPEQQAYQQPHFSPLMQALHGLFAK